MIVIENLYISEDELCVRFSRGELGIVNLYFKYNKAEQLVKRVNFTRFSTVKLVPMSIIGVIKSDNLKLHIEELTLQELSGAELYTESIIYFTTVFNYLTKRVKERK